MDTPTRHLVLRRTDTDQVRAITALTRAASAYPEQRIAQVLSNALCRTSWENDPFYLPDAELAGLLDEYVSGAKSARSNDESAEIKRLRDALQSIHQFAADSLNPVKHAPNAFKILGHVRMMARTALDSR